MIYYPIKCGCRHKSCQDWHVWPVAAVQSVKFTFEQAFAVSRLLNKMEGHFCLDNEDCQGQGCEHTPKTCPALQKGENL